MQDISKEGRSSSSSVINHNLRSPYDYSVSKRKLFNNFHENLWPPGSSAHWTQVSCDSVVSGHIEKMPPNVQAKIVQTSQKTAASSRSLQKNPSLWKSNSFEVVFLYSQSLLCRVQEKNKSLDHCCSHSALLPWAVSLGASFPSVSSHTLHQTRSFVPARLKKTTTAQPSLCSGARLRSILGLRVTL